MSAAEPVSHHPRSLRTAGMVAGRREGKMVMYALSDAGRALLAALGAQAEATR